MILLERRQVVHAGARRPRRSFRKSLEVAEQELFYAFQATDAVSGFEAQFAPANSTGLQFCAAMETKPHPMWRTYHARGASSFFYLHHRQTSMTSIGGRSDRDKATLWIARDQERGSRGGYWLSGLCTRQYRYGNVLTVGLMVDVW